MLRTMIARLVTTALLTGLLVGLLVVSSPGSSQAAARYESWGSVSSKDHVLKRGCHDYGYRYQITTPTREWMAEIFFLTPDGEGLASATFFSQSDPNRGHRRLTVCRSSAPYGRYKIKMKVTWQRENETARVKPAFFRFTRPR